MNASPDFSFFLTDEAEMQAFGARLSGLLDDGDVMSFEGDLGAGKTTMIRGMIRALTSEDEEVPSPTYTIVQTYETPDAMIWHFDLYRLDAPEDVIELGFEDALNDICLIEWPDRAGAFLPEDRLTLNIEHHAEGRKVRLRPGSEKWGIRLNELFG
jgi:tRNA threonylcarbamoyladenosine biosynthesis protein TsaE